MIKLSDANLIQKTTDTIPFGDWEAGLRKNIKWTILRIVSDEVWDKCTAEINNIIIAASDEVRDFAAKKIDDNP